MTSLQQNISKRGGDGDGGGNGGGCDGRHIGVGGLVVMLVVMIPLSACETYPD